MSNEHEHDLERLPHDELDALLRAWHEENAERAAAGKAQMIARLHSDTSHSLSITSDELNPLHRSVRARLAAALRSASLRAAASLGLLITAIALLIPLNSRPALARQEVIMLPEGGKLEARDARGQVIGPCALKHTDVHADIAGPFSRVTVKQQYHNPYSYKIEAVYTFPLSHRAAVDRMTMTVGDRIIEGEVHERQRARQMYESARQAGHVASLLEQERPNIFTQSVANIEPNADVLIEMSYVEMLQQRDGEYTFDFPMVVAPRYIPGTPLNSASNMPVGFVPARGMSLPNELERRDGVILLGPATFEQQKIQLLGTAGQSDFNFSKTPLGPAPYLQGVIDIATPIMVPDGAYRAREDVQALYRANPSFDFDVLYADGTREFGQIAGDGLGHIAGRWFYFDPAILASIQRMEASRIGMGTPGAAFEADTDQVPDASRITPMPVRPPTRAGHDISLTVKIDTGVGGPAIIDWKSDLHEIICTDPPTYHDLGNKINLALKNQSEIPNRDFVLRWRCIDDSIREAVFTHADPKWVDKSGGASRGGGFFTAIIAPPAKAAPETILPRELIFVLDTSGSMQGLPIEKAKSVMSKAIDAMRPGDTFNLITFSGHTRILWKSPRPNTEANRAEAQAMLAAQAGAGGTEMMTAINAALTQTAADASGGPQALTAVDLANLPADGREVIVRTRFDDIEANVRKNAVMQPLLRVRDDLKLKTTSFGLPVEQMGGNPLVELRGKWSTINGERTLEVASAARVEEAAKPIEPLRIVMFLTDGQVGNDDAIIAAVREHAKTTRVFSFGIGDSPNRYLLDGIAQAGRGEAAYVNLTNDAEPAVQAFARRIESPVLRDIEISFSDGLEVFDMMPATDAIPDLWDVKPLVIHGRYSCAKHQSGKITITGKTASGDYTRVIDLTLPAREEGHSMLPALWARAKIDDVLARDDGIKRNGAVQYASDEAKRQVIATGERYGITSAFTSFVAIEKTRLTIAGQPMLVPIPIEMPSGMSYDGIFGGDCGPRNLDLWQAARKADPSIELSALFDTNGSIKDPAVIDALANKVRKNPLTIELAHANKAALADEFSDLLAEVDAEKKAQAGRLDFAGAPELDLDGALALGQLHYRFSETDTDGTPLESNYGLDASAYYAQAQQQLGEVDPASLARLGVININSVDLRQLSDLPLVGLRYPASDGTWKGGAEFPWQTSAGDAVSSLQGGYKALGSTPSDLALVGRGTTSGGVARGEELSIDKAGRQLRADARTGKLVPVTPSGGGGGGFGGGGPPAPPPAPPPPPPAGAAEQFTGGSVFKSSAAEFGEKERIQAELAAASASRSESESARVMAESVERGRREQQVADGLERAKDLVNKKKLDEAEQVIDEVLFLDEHNAEATAMRGAIAASRGEPATVQSKTSPSVDETVTVEQRKFAADAVIAQLKREDRMRRVIDQRLWPAALARLVDRAMSAAAVTPSLSQRQRAQPVVILVTDVDDATIALLKSHGVRIDDVNASLRIIAGEIADADTLVDVALLECVRRIEPIAVSRPD